MFKFRMYLLGGAMLVGLAGMMLDPRAAVGLQES